MQFLQVSTYSVIFVAMLSCNVSAQIIAEGFPSRPVTTIVASAAGGPNDIEARLYSAKLNLLTRQQFIVDNKAGGSGTIGAYYVAKSAPDGYTLLQTDGNFTTFTALYKALPFNSIKDFAPVSLMTLKHFVLVVSSLSPVKTLTEYFTFARANPGKLNFGTTGTGGSVHLAGAWLHNLTNTKVTFVAYKGTPPLVLDLAAGRLDVAPLGLQAAIPLIQSGKMHPLAIMGNKRSKLLPNLATIAEQNVPGYAFESIIGFSAPGGTPIATIDKLNELFVTVLKMPDIVLALEAQGSVPVGSTPAQFRQLLENLDGRWRKVVRENEIKIDD